MFVRHLFSLYRHFYTCNHPGIWDLFTSSEKERAKVNSSSAKGHLHQNHTLVNFMQIKPYLFTPAPNESKQPDGKCAQLSTAAFSYPAGTISNHDSDVSEHAWRVLHESRVVQTALQVAGSHQRPVTQVAPQQPALQLPLAHDLLPGSDSSGAFAAQSHDVDGPEQKQTSCGCGWTAERWRRIFGGEGEEAGKTSLPRSLLFMSITETVHHRYVTDSDWRAARHGLDYTWCRCGSMNLTLREPTCF